MCKNSVWGVCKWIRVCMGRKGRVRPQRELGAENLLLFMSLRPGYALCSPQVS